MKTSISFRAVAVAAVSLALVQGCAMFASRPAPVPQYEVPPSPRVGSVFVPDAAPSGERHAEVYAIGKVRAAPDARDRAIRAVDAETGRSARVSGWELAVPPEELVAKALRTGLWAVFPDATVCDASLAPRGVAATHVECWIEIFRVERRADGWYFVLDATLVETAPDGGVESRRVAAAEKLGDGRDEPPPETVVVAIGGALRQIESAAIP